jgi:tripartite-type tricarboxylate transporter receptor subunit TctC
MLRRTLLACAAMAAAAPQIVRAQGAAASPLRLIVPFTPGTGIDLIARTVGPKLGERFGRAVVVDNRPGASGNTGTEAVVRAAPDGSTLLVSVSTLVMNRALFRSLSFDPVRDLEPVALTSWGQLLLVTHPKTGWRGAQDLLEAARRQPDRLNYASPGIGTPHHLAMELLKNTARVGLTHVPYGGTAPALTDLLGGRVDAMFLPIHVALPQVRGGRLVALAIGSPRRHALLPELPTLAEAGVGNVDVDMWYGVFAPRGTPAETVAAYNRELRAILGTDEVRRAFSTQGMDPAASTPEEFARLVERDAQRWAQLIKAQGITAD